jgi:hypothetical protein
VANGEWRIYLGLVHSPVYNKSNEVITSGITNLDVHDISRSAMTYGVKSFFLIHPNERQKEIFEHILRFWKSDVGCFFNPHRVDALSIINFSDSIEMTIDLIRKQEGSDPIIITTTARRRDNQKSFLQTSDIIELSDRPVLILFGTGNGLHESVHETADFVLVPIQATSGYNHLSVRSAVAIVLDRLLSVKYKEE